MKTKGEHPTADALLEALETPDTAATLAHHFQSCRSCRRTYADLAPVIAGLKRGPLPEPSAEVLSRLRVMLPSPAPRSSGVIETLLGLVSAPPTRRLAYGVRGASRSELRQYAGNGLDLSLELTATGTGVTLHGQALPAAGAPLPAVVWSESDGRPDSPVAVEPHGLFVLQDLPSSGFDLVLDSGDRRWRLQVAVDQAEP